jgi:rfaE bifunctional protein nucleotidyltransferase chain/domain
MSTPVSRDAAVEQCRFWQAQGLKVGFTSGTFDIIHPGHTDYLTKARKQCDKLIVGVNTDASVRMYKGLSRPIVSEQHRAQVVTALKPVDLVFLFPERNNNHNIELLKPDIYIKAGDYSKDQLSSAPLVESYGGSVLLIPPVDNCSSSSIIKRVESQSGIAKILPTEVERKPAIFLDRDGTINRHIDYLHEPDKFELLNGVVEGLKLLSGLGFRLIITTNQPGINMGYFTVEDFFAVNLRMLSLLSKEGILVDKIYFSPATKAEKCHYRKPGIGMALRAQSELRVPLEKSWVIGDTTTDIRFGKNAGCKTVLVTSGKDEQEKLYEADADFVASDLLKAAEYIRLQS